MKTDIHPKYQPVVFQDLSSDFAFLTQSTMSSKETIKWEDGKEYPLIKVEISSHSQATACTCCDAVFTAFAAP